MEAKSQTQPHNHLFFSGPKGIKRQLESKARLKIKGEKITLIDQDNPHISALISAQKRLKNWILSQPMENQKELTKIIKRTKADAIKYLLDNGGINENQIRVLGISEADLLFERAFLLELKKYISAQLNEDAIYKTGIVHESIGGILPDYSELNRISDDLQFYYLKEKELSTLKLNRPDAQEKYDKYGSEIEYDLEDQPEEVRLKAMETGIILPESNELTLRECVYKIRELQKEYRIELYKTSAEKSIPKNLCFFLVNSLVPMPIGKTEDDVFRGKISKLRKSNLLLLLQLLCNIHNSHYKKEIETTQKLRIKMKRSIKKYSSEEKRLLVQMGKSDGLKQKDVIEQTGFGRTTVQKYWK